MHVVIVGNGITGVTVARHVRKRNRDARITMISGESDHPWSRTALMYIYMGHMRFEDTKLFKDPFWAKNRIDRVRGWVTQIDTEKKQVHLDACRVIGFDKLVLAVGSKPNKFGWPGQDLDGVSGMVSVQDLEGLETITPGIKAAAVVGGGLIGIELAEMLHSRGIHVHMLVRESLYWSNVLPPEEASMVVRVIRKEGIDLRLETELKEIVDDGTGKACAVVTSKGERLEVGYVGLTAGVRPNLAVCEGSGIETARGILVDWKLQTNVPDVYAAGDCAEIKTPEGERNLIQAVWYTGRMHGEVVAAQICGEDASYDPGIWFNAAKFVDLEYQVFGFVPSRPDESVTHHYWEAPDGLHALRLVEREGKIVGFNVMGIRLRHQVCEAWIREGRDLAFVLKNLRKAWFDPELYRRWDKVVRAELGSKAA